MPKLFLLSIAIMHFLFGCSNKALLDKDRLEIAVTDQETVDHTLFDSLLGEYVDEDGLVNYTAIKAGDVLDDYLNTLASVDVALLSEKEAIAFWLNAYNAYTIKLIVENYPVGSIREISPFRIKGLRLAVPKINSPFEYKIAAIGGKEYSLDDIEHAILRKEYDEPRIHFALVCAAISCPALRNEAYIAERLDEQLDDQALVFLSDETKNRIEGDTIYLSKIFNWFRGDFADSNKELQHYLARYFEDDLAERLSNGAFKVKHLAYDWTLNDWKAEG